MCNIKGILLKTLLISGISLTASLSAEAQDLLARQAPIDRKMKKVDTLALQNIINRENMQSPAAALYEDWSNDYVHKANELPDSFDIDLHHFCMPTPSRVITSNFGSRWGRQHKGLDIKVYIGDTIRAAFSGKVRVVSYEGGGYGKYIVIRHYNGLETVYGHLSKQLVEENEVVHAGDVIGLGGNTGRSTGSHLHFETCLCGVALNPALFFDFRAQDIVADHYLFRKSTIKEESADATLARGKVGNGSYSRSDVKGAVVGNLGAESYAHEKLYHKVVSGETLSSIAEKRGVSVETLCRLNHLSKRSKVRPGQILRYS